jgi:LuxR family maltose regulon positive regulatory protein
VWQGRLAEAARWAAPGVGAGETELASFERLTLVGLRLAEHRLRPAPPRLEEAATLLGDLLTTMEARGWRGWVIAIRVLQALVARARGDAAGALATLAEALALAEPEGYIRIFADEGEPMAALLAEAGRRGVAPAYVARLLAAFPRPEPAPAAAPRGSPRGALAEPLSERERAVLRLLVAGLAGPAIARELSVGHSTVRTHLKSIYGKLAVHSRDQAIARARELRLV